MNRPIDYVLVLALIATLTFWFFDHQKLQREAQTWHCKFDLIDPIRAEAGVPLDDCCKELLFKK